MLATPQFHASAKYAWILTGFVNEWSDYQSFTEKEFTNLPPGAYTFKVKIPESAHIASFSFTVKSPWYATVVAKFFYGLAVFLLFAIWEYFFRRRLNFQRIKLEKLNEEELNKQLREVEHKKLVSDIENQGRELSNAALSLVRKNEMLQHLKDALIASKNDPKALSKITRHIDEHIEGDHDWAIFETAFNQVHNDFFKCLMTQFPDLTPGDLRLAAYLKMNLSSKEIAPLLNISIRGIENKRYRLRKKLGLSEEANLTEFIISY